MKTTENGRALPPRPALMVGDEAACKAMWSKLRTKARGLVDMSLEQKQMRSDEGLPCKEYDGIVWQLRALRESLISNGMLEEPQHWAFVVEVYELSAEACAAANSFPELLKCLQVLVGQLYPAVAQFSGGLVAGPHRLVGVPASQGGLPAAEPSVQDNSCPEDRDGGGGSSLPPRMPHPLNRQSEFAAAQVLFFACVPSSPSRLDVLSVLRAASLNSLAAAASTLPLTLTMTHPSLLPSGPMASSPFISSDKILQVGCDLDVDAALRPLVTLASDPLSTKEEAMAAGMQCNPRDAPRRAVSSVWRSTHMQYALAVLSALSAPDPARVITLGSCPPTPLLGALVRPALPRARRALMRVLATAYRTLPVAAALHCLGWSVGQSSLDNPFNILDQCSQCSSGTSGIGSEQGNGDSARWALAMLATLLKEAMDKGCRGSARAFAAMTEAAWERESGRSEEISPDLVFKI